MVSGILCHVVWYTANNNSHKATPSIYVAAVPSLILNPHLQGTCIKQVTQKVWYLPSSLCGVTPHKTVLLAELSEIHVP